MTEHPLGLYPKVVFLSLEVGCFLIFCEITTLIYKMGCTSLHSHQQCRSVPFTPHSFQHKLSSVFWSLPFLQVQDGIWELFWFAFLWWLKMLSISLFVFQPFEIPLLRIPCLGLYPIFFIGLFVLLMTNYLSSLSILEISSLFDVGLVKIFFPFCRLLFCLVDHKAQNFYSIYLGGLT